MSVGSSLFTVDHPILVGIFEGFSWIRCEGKGSFLNSPAVKAFGDQRIAAGEQRLVIDLAGCTGMDSTFMGTLAGMAARLSTNQEGVLQIAEPGERNRRSLEDLGLDFLMEIDPPAAVWRGKVQSIRENLHPPQNGATIGTVQRARHVLEAHKTLADMNEKNSDEFAGVVEMLETDLIEKQKAARTEGQQ